MAESTTTTSGTSNYYYVYPDCPYRHVCSDNEKKCESCRYNPKRSYYEPVEPYIPYIPYVPYYPYYPYWQSPIWYNTITTNGTYYQES